MIPAFSIQTQGPFIRMQHRQAEPPEAPLTRLSLGQRHHPAPDATPPVRFLSDIAEVFSFSVINVLDAAHADRFTFGKDAPNRIIVPCRKAGEPGLLRLAGDGRRIRQETDLRIVQPVEGTLQKGPVERNQGNYATVGRHASTRPCSPDSP